MLRILLTLTLFTSFLYASDKNPFDKVSEEEKVKLSKATERERLYLINELNSINIEFGLGYMKQMTSDNLTVDNPEFAQDLSSGKTFSISYFHYFESSLGFGFGFSSFSSKASIKVIDEYNNIYTLEDKILIPTFNIACGFKKVNLEENILYGVDGRIAIGPFIEKISLSNMNAEFSSITPLLGANFFIEYLLNRTTGIGLSCTGYYGSTSELFQKGGSDIQLATPLSLSRIDILLSLRFHFKGDV